MSGGRTMGGVRSATRQRRDRRRIARPIYVVPIGLRRGGVAYVAVSLLIPLKTPQQWLRKVTIGAVVVAVVFLNLEIFLAPDRDISLLGRVAGAAGVVASCGSLALLIVLRLNQRGVVVEPTEEITSILLYCPRVR